MEEKIELNAFLNRLITTLNKKFEVIEEEIRNLKRDIDSMRQSQSKDEEPLKVLDSKIRNLEFSVNSLRSKSQVDGSLLKVLESEKV
jgi:predicted  nucleic acid-binding Zn-ribbon protein